MCFAICWQCWLGTRRKSFAIHFNFSPSNFPLLAKSLAKIMKNARATFVCVCWFFECFSFLIFGPRWQSEIRLLFYGLINAPRSGTFALASFAVNWNWNKLFILIYVCCALCVCVCVLSECVWGDRCADSRLCIIFLRGDFLFIATGIKSELFISAHT